MRSACPRHNRVVCCPVLSALALAISVVADALFGPPGPLGGPNVYTKRPQTLNNLTLSDSRAVRLNLRDFQPLVVHPDA